MTASSKSPVVSVIVPSYNTAGYIAECLESVFAQTYRDFEVIVVNDESPDTPALERALEPFRSRIVYLTQKSAGPARARNTAVRASRGRYIALLDSDDAWNPDFLEVQVAALEGDPTLDAIYPDAMLFGDHPHAGRTFMEVCPSNGPVTFAALVTQRCNVLVSLLMRREALFRVGLFDESLRSVEDFDLWARLVAQGGRIAYHRKILLRFRKRRDSLSADPVSMFEHVTTVLRKLDCTLALGDDDRRLVRERLAYFLALLELAKGKRAFFNLDTQAAVAHIEGANEYFRSRRLTLASAMIRTTPKLLLRLYDWRDRLLVGGSTRF
jgi:glycosyltransferase involved in cell wall biosynthesis